MQIVLHRVVVTITILAAASLAAHPTRAQLPAEQELKTLRAAPGFEVSLFAAEPMVVNPAAIDVDTHGRVWVAEIQWYRGAAKNPPSDRIKVLEDTDGDGRADRVTTFADGLFCPMSVCVAGDRVYVATSPDLWMYEDKNGDLKADGPPKKVLTGFGGHNHDHGAHSIVLGPDHKWWMAHGDTGFDVTGVDGSRVKYQWGAMLRGELDGSQLEAIAVNFRNSYELCVSSFGECFCSDNDNDGNFSVRICWILEGGNYGWFGSPPPKPAPGTPFGEHWHFRGHIPGHVPATLVTGFGSPTGICYYEGDAFGPKYKNAPLHTDCGPREVRLYRHQTAGAGMKATSEVFVSGNADPYFRPDDICAGPAGELYLADWYDGGVGGHAYNDPDRGRIFLLTPAGRKPVRQDKPGPYTNAADALAALASPNLATQYLAREKLLADGEASLPVLTPLLAGADANLAARAMWLLDRIGGSGRAFVAKQLASGDDSLRALAVRILRRRGTEHEAAILALAGDSSTEVRREILLAIAKLNSDAAQDTLARMAREADLSDRYMLEGLAIAAGTDKTRLYARLEKQGSLSLAQLPLLQLLNPKAAADLLTARVAAGGLDNQAAKTLLDTAGNISSVEAGRVVLGIAAGKNVPADLRRLALARLSANLGSAWSGLIREKSFADAMAGMLAERELAADALAVVGRWNIASLGKSVLAAARSSELAGAVRVQAVQVAARLRPPGAIAALRELLAGGDASLARAAQDALIDMQHAPTIREALTGPAAGRLRASDRLMESTGGAFAALRLVEEGKLAADVQARLIAKAASHVDSYVRILFERHIPPEQRPQRLGAKVKPEEILALSANAKRGEAIFAQSSAAQCKTCHTVRGVGGAIGPDLSLIGKKYERKALLETILEPSKAIAPEYVPYLLETQDGQIYAGLLASRDEREVVVKDAKGELVRVAAQEIASLSPRTTSLMPELVLRDVTAQDAADLLAFLLTLNQGDLAVSSFRIAGPFDTNGGNLDTVFDPERSLSSPDLSAEFPGMSGKSNKWEIVQSDGALGFAAIDTVKYDQNRGLRPNAVTHYFLVFADSAAEQPAKLIVGSDDGCKIWLNGSQVHKNNVTRALAAAQDTVDVQLKRGRNTIVMKVVNGSPPGGAALSIRAAGEVQLRTE